MNGGFGTAHPGRAISPAPRAEWQAVYESDPDALIYHSPMWMDLICEFAGYEDASRLYELDGGRLALLPMVRKRVPAGLSWEASFPAGWGRGGVIASGGARSSDIAVALSDLGGRGVLRTSLRPDPLAAPKWEPVVPADAVAVPRVAHVLGLEGGFGTVWSKRFAKNARRDVRRAERAGLTVERDTSGRLVPVFYELYERSLDRWASQQHEPRRLAHWRAHRRDSERKLQATADRLGERCVIWVASLDGRPAAASVVLLGPNANYTRGAMDRELAGPTCANHLLQQLAIEDACAAGCRHYHMGETGQVGSLARFKERFGARPCPHADYHIERLPITSIDHAMRGAVKRVIGFRDVPSGSARA